MIDMEIISIIIGCAVLVLFIPIATYFMHKKAKKFAYKIGKITDNRNRTYYKIFAKKEGDKEYRVLNELPYFKWKQKNDNRWIFNDYFDTKEEANKILEDLLFYLGIQEYSEKVEILN